MAVLESPRFVNPYEIIRPYFSKELGLRFGKERILLGKEAIIGFGNTDESFDGTGVILFATTNKKYPVLTEYGMFTGKGISAEEKPDEIGTMDLFMLTPQRIFLGQGGEYEIRTRERGSFGICVQILSTHQFIPKILPWMEDYNQYLMQLQTA